MSTPDKKPTTMDQLADALDALVQQHGFPDLSGYLKHRTSRKIPFATDRWGNRDETHFELRHLGTTLQITCLPDKIKLLGFVNVTQSAVNVHEITKS